MRLIDADALINDIKNCLWDWESVDGITVTTVLKQTIADIENQPTVGGWVSVKDRPPEEDGDYLVYSIFELIDRLRFFDGVWWDYGVECQPGVVTHWMPQPETPKEYQIKEGKL